VVLRDGHLVATHKTAQVPVSTLLRDMVGRSIERIFPNMEAPSGTEVIRIDGLTSAEGAFRDVGFSVHAGEVFGIAGIVGAGRTELVRAIAGADPVASGSITLDGAPLRLGRPDEAIRRGIVLVPEDRKGQGVVLDHSIADNLAISRRW
jgi:ribose transport system ATP-binding protein